MNKEDPLVSIIVRTKDRPILLKKAMQSIAAQTHRPIEVLVVNDGGCALDVEELKTILGDASLNYIRLEKNTGRAHAGNVGIENAKGEYIGFLDDDDELYPDHISVLVGYLTKSDIRVAYTDSLMVYDAYDPYTKEISTTGKKLVYSQDFDYATLIFENYIPLMCLLFAREVLVNSGGFDSAFELCEDWDLLIRLGEKYPFYHIRKTTADYRQWSGTSQISHTNKDIYTMLNSYLRVINKHMDKFTAERIHNYRSKKYEGVNNYEAMLSDKAVQVEQLESRLASLETALKDKDMHLNHLESLLAEKAVTLEKIYRSRGWKTLQIYYKLRDRILCRH